MRNYVKLAEQSQQKTGPSCSLTADRDKQSRGIVPATHSISQNPLASFLPKKIAGKMAEFHVYFLSLLVLSCCLQILAGYGIRCLQFWYVFSWRIMCDVLVLLLFLQERFLHDSRRPSRRQQKPNQASLQKIGDEVAP